MLALTDISNTPITDYQVRHAGHPMRLATRSRQIADMVEAILLQAPESLVLGPYVTAMEQAMRSAWGPENISAVVGMSSGTMSLWSALETLELEPGDEVILPPYTFMATAQAISTTRTLAGKAGQQRRVQAASLVPIFVDIDPRTYTLDPRAVEAALTSRTRAIIPVHMNGLMADMDPLLALAEQHGLVVIEDAAQAHGATYTAASGLVKRACAMGDLAALSLSPVKNMGSHGPDAGAIFLHRRFVERHPEVQERQRAFRNAGRSKKISHRYRHPHWGGQRARIDDFSAAEITAELALLDDWNQRRRAIAASFDAALARSSYGLLAPHVPDGRSHVYHNYVVQAPTPEARVALEQRMTRAGIEVVDAYTLACDQEQYASGLFPSRIEDIAVARGIGERLAHIPCYPELQEWQVARIEAVLAA